MSDMPTRPDQNPDSYVEDSAKAAEMAYAEQPYIDLIANAELAVKNGVKGMATVLEELKNNAHQKVEQTSGEYDDLRKQIEAKKLEIATNILDALKEPRFFRELLHSDGGDRWMLELHPDEFNEIVNVAFALTGVSRCEPDEYGYCESKEHRQYLADNPSSGGELRRERLERRRARVKSVSTGLEIEEILMPREGVALDPANPATIESYGLSVGPQSEDVDEDEDEDEEIEA